MTRYRIVQEHALYYVTFTVVEWLPVFVAEESCRTILFDEDLDSDRLRLTLADLRKYTGRQLTDYCASHMPMCFAKTLLEAGGQDRQHRFWQAGTHPEAIYTQTFWRQKVDYMHDNPCRKGLVRAAHHWRFSSAAYWLNGGESDVILTPVEW